MKQTSIDYRNRIIAWGMLLVLIHIGAVVMIVISASRTVPQTYLRPFQIALLHQNEFLFLAGREPNGPYQVNAVDVSSGRERATDIPVPLPWHGWVSDGERLWVLGGDVVFQIEGTNQKIHRQTRRLKSRFCPVFLYNGSPAVIESDGVYRLLVLTDGEWEEQGEVALPGVGRSWVKDESSGEERLVPLAEVPRTQRAFESEYLIVKSVEKTPHLFHFANQQELDGSWSTVTAYRTGNEFVTRDAEIASALTPNNAPADATGWKKLDFPRGRISIQIGVCSRSPGGLLLMTRSESSNLIQFWELTPPGSPQPFRVVREMSSTGQSEPFNIASSHDGKEVYFIQDRNLFCPQIYRFEDGDLKEIPFQKDTPISRWLRWITGVMTQMAVVLALGAVLVVCGGSWLALRQDDLYDFGHDTVRFASIGRRTAARCLDVIVLLSPLIVHGLLLWPVTTEEQFFRFYWGSGKSEEAFVEFFQGLLPDVLTSSALFVVMTWMQSRWGVTPGKWLCSIRTIRTTLRPCGFARSLLRELMMTVDAPLLLTPIPAIASMLVTHCRQRLGDLAADTLVIDVRRSRPRNPTTKETDRKENAKVSVLNHE